MCYQVYNQLFFLLHESPCLLSTIWREWRGGVGAGIVTWRFVGSICPGNEFILYNSVYHTLPMGFDVDTCNLYHYEHIVLCIVCVVGDINAYRYTVLY